MPILDRFRLDGRTAIVTGASSGLGVAFAIALAEAGADVVLAARRADRLEETKAAAEAFGHVDILVNNAGIGTAVPATREKPEDFRRVIDVNLNGCYWMAQECGRVMGRGSSIVNISSVLGITTAGLPQAAYSSSKAGLIGLTRDLAQQWTGRKGIRVNAIAPGFFQSEMTDQYPEDYIAAQTKRVVAGRWGEAEELAAALIFLASDAASYITGQTIVVDGGITLT
jgi:NAD(P)-dependent dehydrogenase (short-subunit alcohol dehydrogenase family)